MRIAVIGGGPAGLYAAQLWKSRHPGDTVVVHEQHAPDATFGFGVVFSDQALAFLTADDPVLVDRITPHMQRWRDMTLTHRGATITIDGVGFAAIGRLALLKLLQQRACEVGVDLNYSAPVRTLDDLATAADVVIAADGVNSLARRARPTAFAVTEGALNNHFAWYGTTARFETLTQTFVDSPWGPFNAHHYRYSPTMSTFIVECGPETWRRAGFANLDEAASLARCEVIFADTLRGNSLIANKSVWRRFPLLWANRWADGNVALVGDAAHTAHFSIGSGTRLALEDAIALVQALEAHPGDVPAGLTHYDAIRRPLARKIVDASLTSAAWYERFGDHMALPPWDFAMSYITRSGRLDRARLRALAPCFTERYEAATGKADVVTQAPREPPQPPAATEERRIEGPIGPSIDRHT